MTISEYLEQTNMRLEDFAFGICVSKESLQHYIKGRQSPTLYTALRIIRMTKGEVGLDDLIRMNKKNG